jgi:hypothetical protein
MKMSKVKIKEVSTEVFLELTPVVSEYVGNGEWEYLTEILEELGGCEWGMWGGCECKACSGVEVDTGNDVASTAIDVLFEGIECDDVTGVASN